MEYSGRIYDGRIYGIDLSTNEIKTEIYTENDARKLLGGFGFNTGYLYRNLGPEIGPLDPGNILIISPGLLTGSAVPASSRLHISARSPLSGLMGSSNVGGHIGTRLRSLNVASIIIRGSAERLSYILINETGLSIHECEELRGADTRECENRLRTIYPGKLVEMLSIGIGGENMVSYACIMHGEDHAAGRTGLGAVMGSKNLKAIVVEGIKIIEKNDEAVRVLLKGYIDNIRSSLPIYDDFSKFGSSAHILPLNDAGQLGTRNYREGRLDGVENIDGRNLKNYVSKNTSCHRCPVHCKAEIRIEAGRHKGFTGGRPEYETVINMGSLCGLSDPDELLFLSNFANILGIDTISTGSVIAFAMDLFERGIITSEDTEGLQLTWGNAEAMESLMYRIARKEGFGAVLAHGVREASRIIGRGSEKFAFQTKGVEIYGADPRGAQAMALTYAVSLRGGDFTSVYPVPAFRYSEEQARSDFGTGLSIDPLSAEGKGAMIRKCLFVSAVIDSLGLCKVPALSIIGKFDLSNESALLKNLTGIDLSSEELFTIGERIINMEKLFNIACGAGLSDDSLPEFFQREAMPEGAVKGETVHSLSEMVQDFYRLMGWDKNGVPTDELRRSLGI